ncbi:MAG: HIT family protein [Salinisphaeraceae bacterium]|nr:HIT family protein [Salinisphaeraceae bacterium]
MSQTHKQDDCIFCQILAGKAPAAIVTDDGPIVAFMDIFPLRPGHVLIIPREHHQYVHELDSFTRGKLMDTATDIAMAMRKIHPPGTDINWMINDGKAAWQHVPHVHLHLIPRNGRDNLRLTGNIVTRFLRKPNMAHFEAQAQELQRVLDPAPKR